MPEAILPFLVSFFALTSIGSALFAIRELNRDDESLKDFRLLTRFVVTSAFVLSVIIALLGIAVDAYTTTHVSFGWHVSSVVQALLWYPLYQLFRSILPRKQLA